MNIGDSRAILISKNSTNVYVTPLSKDHLPNDVEERKRIEAKGGVVKRITDKDGNEHGPYRLWNRQIKAPGLSLSRSLGDIYAQSLGLTHEPEITKRLLDIDDKIIVLGSDGIYNFLKNEEIASIVYPFYEKYLKRMVNEKQILGRVFS